MLPGFQETGREPQIAKLERQPARRLGRAKVLGIQQTSKRKKSRGGAQVIKEDRLKGSGLMSSRDLPRCRPRWIGGRTGGVSPNIGNRRAETSSLKANINVTTLRTNSQGKIGWSNSKERWDLDSHTRT